jgi:hypothetical protein
MSLTCRRSFLRMAPGLLCAGQGGARQRPNIVLIYTDDVGYGDFRMLRRNQSQNAESGSAFARDPPICPTIPPVIPCAAKWCKNGETHCDCRTRAHFVTIHLTPPSHSGCKRSPPRAPGRLRFLGPIMQQAAAQLYRFESITGDTACLPKLCKPLLAQLPGPGFGDSIPSLATLTFNNLGLA